MVKLQAYLLLFLLCPFTVLAEPFLETIVKNSTIELGKPVYIKIIAEELESNLSTLPLHALSENFVLASKDLDTETLEQQKGQGVQSRHTATRRQTLSLKLFPRQTGELLIPAFSVENISSDVKLIKVVDATTRGDQISFDWSLSSSSAWQREQIMIFLTITTPEEYANIKLVKQAVDGIELTPLPVKREWIKEKNNGQSKITTGWSLLPLQSGNLNIDLPAVEYILSGVKRRTFYLPKIKLAIRPLPTYLPPTIPVGEVLIETAVRPNGMLSTDELAYWNLSIKSSSLTPYWLPPLLRQVKSDNHIQFYPANSKRSVHPGRTGANGRVDHTIPFKPLKNGFTCLPDLKIQYFDPAIGKLETVRHKTDCSISSGTATRILLSLTLAAFVLFLSTIMFQYWLRRISYSRRRQSVLALIRRASTEKDLLAGIRQLASVEGWPSNITLSEWLKHCQEKFICDKRLEKVLQELSCHYYGSSEQVEFHDTPDSRFQTIQSVIVEQMTSPMKKMANTPNQEPSNLKPVTWDPDPLKISTSIRGS